MNSYLAIIESKLIEILNKNNFFNKIDQTNKEYIIINNEKGIFLIFICDDIELKFKISNFNIYEVTNKINFNDLLNNIDSYKSFNTKYIKFKIELKSFLFLLKVSSNSKLIILKIEDNLNRISLIYNYRETILNVETDQIISNFDHILDFNYQETIILRLLSSEFSNIIVSHQSIYDNQIINDDNQNIQIQISNEKIRFLSTNYIVGLIHQIKIQKIMNDNIQLSFNKNIDITKIYQIFKNSEYVYLIKGNDQNDYFGRIRSKFIKFINEENICYIRLYDSNINTFDETVIDDQLDLCNKCVVDKLIFSQIVDTIKNSFDIKKLNFVDISIINQFANVICDSNDYKFNFNLDIQKYFFLYNGKFKMKISGNTINTIYQILNKIKEISKINIYVSNSGEQGKINYISACITDIIFV